MNDKDTYACMRAFSVALSLMLENKKGICIQLSKDEKDEIFSNTKIIVYKENDEMKINLAPDHIKHGQKVNIGSS